MFSATFIITVEMKQGRRTQVTIESKGDTYVWGLWRFACEYFMNMVIKKSRLKADFILDQLCTGCKEYEDKVISLPGREG